MLALDAGRRIGSPSLRSAGTPWMSTLRGSMPSPGFALSTFRRAWGMTSRDSSRKERPFWEPIMVASMPLLRGHCGLLPTPLPEAFEMQTISPRSALLIAGVLLNRLLQLSPWTISTATRQPVAVARFLLSSSASPGLSP
jgi:hypothetical protein